MNQPQPRPQKAIKSKQPQQLQPAHDDDELDEGGSRFLLFNVMPSWMVSFLTHIVIIIVLAYFVLPAKQDPSIAFESGEIGEEAVESININLDTLELDVEDAFEEEEIVEQQEEEIVESVEVSLPEEQVDFSNLAAVDESFESAEIGQIGSTDITQELNSRTGQAKERLKKKYGASAASEESVELALQWIVKHQLPDGGWNLDHTIGPGNFRDSPDPGQYADARSGATALALLPLLGSGHTHMAGKYKESVQKGLQFLTKRARRSKGKGISYLESQGTMYSHGLVSIVFCEAFALTKDPELAPYAQGTVWYIEEAQDPIGGGWRYQPRQPGDTSAVGWQLMALKSAKISGLNTDSITFKRAEKFLDSVSTSGGAFYGYATPPPTERADARTAVGLLCRMYMGWDKDVPGLVDGVDALTLAGPSTGKRVDMYYNYYATQVVKHFGGRKWKDWNVEMRDFLVASQDRKGNARGSWHFGQTHAGDRGGRLYNTALACMTLEVYYRFLPLYGDDAANDEFLLE